MYSQKKSTNTPQYQFLLAQLDLFGKLCKVSVRLLLINCIAYILQGNNTEAVKTIDQVHSCFVNGVTSPIGQ